MRKFQVVGCWSRMNDTDDDDEGIKEVKKRRDYPEGTPLEEVPQVRD